MKIHSALLIRFCSHSIVNGPHPRNRTPPFDLKYIESILSKEGIKTEIVDLVCAKINKNDLIMLVRKYIQQLIVISFTTLETSVVDDFMGSLKEKDAFFAGVGQGVGFYSEAYSEWLRKNFSVVFPGEPEIALTSCVRDINHGADITKIQQDGWADFSKGKIHVVMDVNSLPPLTTTAFEIKNYGNIYPLRVKKHLRWGYVLSSRGCPYGCVFCSPIMRKSYGGKLRYRAPQLVADEISGLLDSGVNAIAFEDDDLTCSHDYLTSLCKEFLRRDLKFYWLAHARVNELSVDLIDLMKRSGCILLRFGVESCDFETLRLINKGCLSEWKAKTEEVFSCLRNAGIGIDAMFMIGSPQETIQQVEENIEFSTKVNPDCIQVAQFAVYPGCRLFSELPEEKKDELLNLGAYHYEGISLNLSSMKVEDVLRMQKKFYRKFILRPKFILSHLFEFWLFYLKNPNVFFKLLVGFMSFSLRK